VSFNAISTAAHTIWGVLAGQLLLSGRKEKSKMSILMIAGIVCLAAGYSLNFVTPIIKRIATSSFVLASGGWTILALALSYWLIDVKKRRKGLIFSAISSVAPCLVA
jgi:predicted acyltransferase